MTFIDYVGLVPAIIFPVATVIQLMHLLKTKSSSGISIISWIAFAIGNLCLYIYTEKYFELQSIVGLLLTSILQVYIVLLVIKYRRNEVVSD